MLPSTEDKPTKLLKKVERTLSNKKLVPAEKLPSNYVHVFVFGVCVCVCVLVNS